MTRPTVLVPRRTAALVDSVVQRHRVQERPLGADDIEPPTRPIVDIRTDLMPQLGDGELGLILGAFQIVDFDPCIVDDLFVIVYKVEEAAHFGMDHPLERDVIC